jgi:hypothetical protein
MLLRYRNEIARSKNIVLTLASKRTDTAILPPPLIGALLRTAQWDPTGRHKHTSRFDPTAPASRVGAHATGAARAISPWSAALSLESLARDAPRPTFWPPLPSPRSGRRSAQAASKPAAPPARDRQNPNHRNLPSPPLARAPIAPAQWGSGVERVRVRREDSCVWLDSPASNAALSPGATAASRPARNASSSPTSASSNPRIARCIAPLSPFPAPSQQPTHASLPAFS